MWTDFLPQIPIESLKNWIMELTKINWRWSILVFIVRNSNYISLQVRASILAYAELGQKGE